MSAALRLSLRASRRAQGFGGTGVADTLGVAALGGSANEGAAWAARASWSISNTIVINAGVSPWGGVAESGRG
jgi:hypothetical protein